MYQKRANGSAADLFQLFVFGKITGNAIRVNLLRGWLLAEYLCFGESSWLGRCFLFAWDNSVPALNNIYVWQQTRYVNLYVSCVGSYNVI